MPIVSGKVGFLIAGQACPSSGGGASCSEPSPPDAPAGSCQPPRWSGADPWPPLCPMDAPRFPQGAAGWHFCRQEKEGIPRGGTAMIRPRCPYPHEFGTTSPQTPDEWMKACRFLRFRSLTFMLAHDISPYLLFSIESVWQILRFTFCHQVYQQKVNENISFENTF